MLKEVLGSVEGEDDQQAKQLDSLLSKLSSLPALLEQVQGMETRVKLVSARSMTPASIQPNLSAIQQCFSLIINQPTVLSTMACQPNEQEGVMFMASADQH